MTDKGKTRNRSTAVLVMLALCIGMIASTAFLTGQPDIDVRQGEKELEIMKSVISTSISMTKKRLREEENRESRERLERYFEEFDGDSIEGYYLHGQGVVFTIPYPCESGGFPRDLEREIDIRLDAIMEDELVNADELKLEMEMLVTEVELQRQELGLPHAVPPPPPPPEAPEVPELPEISEQESASRKAAASEAKKKLEESAVKIRTRLKEAREKSAEIERKAAAEREEIKQELINVLASHGGSLTQVKDSEYINLVLRDRCEFYNWRERDSSRTVLSVKKADIIARLTGQISMDQLRSRIVEY